MACITTQSRTGGGFARISLRRRAAAMRPEAFHRNGQPRPLVLFMLGILTRSPTTHRIILPTATHLSPISAILTTTPAAVAFTLPSLIPP